MRPTAYTKWFRTVYATYTAALLVGVALNLPWILGVQILPRGWAMLGVLVIPAIPLVIVATMIGLPRRKRLKRIAASEEPRCPWCLYNLTGTSPVNACPECGAMYTLDGVRRYWQGIHARLKRAKRTGFPAWDRWLLEDCGWR